MRKMEITLFMLSSLDGKISTGSSELLDFDTDFPSILGVKEGLHQYYELEAKTSLWSLNTGRVMKKIGVCERKDKPKKSVVSFVIIDNHPHLNLQGVHYLCDWLKELIIVTTCENHPAINCQRQNVHLIIQKKLDISNMLQELEHTYHITSITLQSGGSLNALFLRENLIDFL